MPDEYTADRKGRAHGAVANAVARGKLVRQPCEICGKSPTDGHHDDYDKPLDVRWLCKVHHRSEHKQVPVQLRSGVLTVMTIRQFRDVSRDLLDEAFIVVSTADGDGLREKLGMWVPMWLVDE